jgi:hypothetical protein
MAWMKFSWKLRDNVATAPIRSIWRSRFTPVLPNYRVYHPALEVSSLPVSKNGIGIGR